MNQTLLIVKILLLNLFLTLIGSSAIAQVVVNGTVTDSESEPLVGVNITEQGTTNGTTTGSDGRFEFEVAGPEATLAFTYLGFQTVEVEVGNQTSFEIQMQEDTKLLGDVVVSALGFSDNRDQMGSTASSINPQDITRSGEPTLINSLGSKASNVRVSRTSGDPGAGSSIKIRGANTIGGDSSPLIIVDGVPLNNSTTYGGGNNVSGGRQGGTSQQSRLNDINPSDIETVQVLKGASAAALYGSRAANGVVVITTKDGQMGKPEITYRATQSFDFVADRIPMQSTFGQGRNGVSSSSAESWGDYIPDRAGGENEFDTSGERFIARNGNVYYPIINKNSRETFVDSNWDDAFQTGQYLQHDFSISAGGENSTYYVSLSRLDQEGIIRQSSYDRTSARFNNEYFATDWLTVSSKAFYTRTGSNRIQQSTNTAGLMLGLLRTPPDFNAGDYIGTYINDEGAEFPRRHRSYRRPMGDRLNPIYNNANWTVQEQKSTSNVDRFSVSPEFDIKPLSWLNIILRGNADISTDTRVYFFPIGSGGNRAPGILAEDVMERNEYNFNAIARGLFNPTEGINLTSTVGWNIEDRRYQRRSGQINGFLVNLTKETTDLNTSSENSTFEKFQTNRRSNRAFGILNTNFYDEFILNLSGGLEASSTVRGSFFYPAADLAWIFTNRILEDSFLSFGKLRGSWGKVGVQPSPHRFSTLAETGFRYSSFSDPLDISLFGGGFRIDDALGNQDLKPEIKTEWEIGTDLRFLNDNLDVSFTYYQNKVEDILLFASLSPSSGFDRQYGNFGALENKGIETDISWNVIQSQNYFLKLGLNFSSNQNEVTRLEGTDTIDLTGAAVSSRAIVGEPLGALYGTGSQRDENGDFILDENGFPQLTSSPVVLGDPNPDWNGNFSLEFKWRNIGLNALIEHSQGGVFSPRTLWALNRFGTTQETANRVTLNQDIVNFNGDVIPSGSTVRGNIKDFGGGQVLLDESWYRTGIGGGFGPNQAYDLSIADATFTKLRELTLSYSLNSARFQETTNLRNVTISATGRNLISLDKIDGIDPETNQTGVGAGLGLEYFTNPQTRSFLLSVAITY